MYLEIVTTRSADLGNFLPGRHTVAADAANIETTLSFRDRKLIP